MKQQRRRPAFPRLEFLEDRCTPASFIVNTAADTVDADLNNPAALDASGKTSLRAAIQQANHTAGTDTITFVVPANDEGPGTLTIALMSALDSLSSDININGPGAESVTVTRSGSATTNFQIFTVTSGADCTIGGLSITGGRAGNAGAGGGIENSGELLVSGCHIFGNAAGSGGGIYNAIDATIEVQNSTISANSAKNGGGIYNYGNMVLSEGTEVSGNAADEDGGGILNYSLLTSVDTVVSGNTADRHGGGVLTAVELSWLGGSIINNSAGENGGGVYLLEGTADFDGVTINYNSAVNGGGLYLFAGTASLINSSILHNTASGLGSRIYSKSGSSCTIINCYINGTTYWEP